MKIGKFAFGLVLVLTGRIGGAETKLCPGVILKEGRLSLSANEKVLVCGSAKGSEGWKEIPLSQAEYQLKVFLRNAGYLEPRFERRGDKLFVWTGPRLLIKKIEVQGTHGALDPSRLRHVVGYPLTSEMLDGVTSWALTELKSAGYPCPQVEVKAQAWDKTITVRAETGPRALVGKWIWDGHGDLDHRILSRYAALAPGDVYDGRGGQLTTTRMFADGLFEMARVQPKCGGETVDMLLTTSIGAPRFLRFGFGASTEEWPFVDVSYRNSRLDNRASSFYALLHASPIGQSLTAGSEIFATPSWPTIFWGPRMKLGRESERQYEVVSSKIGVDIGRYWDEWGARWYGRGGPTWNYTNTVRGVGPSESYYLSWEASLRAASHAYEMGIRDQFEGWTGQFGYLGQRDRIGSAVNVDRFDLTLKNLWNIKSYAPPLFVLASRVNLVAVTASPIDLSSRRDLLPVEYRIFWGGDQTLRGFSRQHLNNDGLGYLTGAYAGFELRLIEELPYKFQPFLLWDVAQLGERRWTLDPTVFSSWGGGMRWASPVGTLRASAAKGELDFTTTSTVAYRREWVYFLSFGQEF